MRRIDDTPLDPEIAAQIDAIDATLAGDPVDPRHAELAELALLVTAERPVIDPGFASALDRRVERRFAGGESRSERAGGAAAVGEDRPRRRRLGWHRSLFGPLAGLGTAAVAAVVAVVVLSSLNGGSSPGPQRSVRDFAAPATSTSASSSASSPGSATGSAASTAGGSAAVAHGAPPTPSASSGSATTAAASANAAVSKTSTASASSGGASSASGGAIFAPAGALQRTASAPRPVPNGRKIIQSAQLALTTPSDRIDTVAQELYDVVGRENGYVNNSEVTAGSGGYAQFQLSVPSSSLQATMTALSQLHYAKVASRTDAVQDVNGQYLSDQRQLADARALRTSLLKQLAAATTQVQIDSLKARIRDAEASIRSDESTLHNLTHRIDYSQITVSLNADNAPAPQHHSSRGFTIGKAAHDAGRVLTVAAGVALITLAVLVPLALVGALAWWISAAARRRRREHALDLA